MLKTERHSQQLLGYVILGRNREEENRHFYIPAYVMTGKWDDQEKLDDIFIKETTCNCRNISK